MFLLHRASPWLAGIVFSGIAAAIMGTVNAFLNVGAAAVTHDLPVAFGRRVRNELATGRVATVIIAALAAALALLPGQVVAFLGILAWGLFASTLVPSLAIGMNWTGATRIGAIASMLVGLGVTLVFETLKALKVYTMPVGVSASGLALVLSITAFFVMSWLTRSDAAGDLDADVRIIMEV